MRLSILIFFSCLILLIHCVLTCALDSFGEFGACSTRRHSKGILILFIFVSFFIRILADYLILLFSFPFCYFHLFGFSFLFQIWDSVPKPQAHKDTPLSDFFNVRCHCLIEIRSTLLLCSALNYKIVQHLLFICCVIIFQVEVVALSSFEEKEEQFREQVLVWFVKLRHSYMC